MIPASVQTTADTSSFGEYAIAALCFVAGFWLLLFLLVELPRLLRPWVASRQAINEATAYCRREADRQAQR